MLETSKDLFFIVLAFSILWLTIFLSWWVFYMAQLTKNLNSVVDDVRKKLKLVFDTIDFIRDKMGILASAAGFASKHFFGKDAEEEFGEKKKSSKRKRK